MAVTQIDLDDEALAEVMRATGVRTKKEAVNLALRELAGREHRLAALARSVQDAESWDFDGWQAIRDVEKPRQ